MFFVFAVVATVAYGLNNTLMASYYRSSDPLLAVTLRGVGLSITMAPLLLWCQGEAWLAAAGMWRPLALAALVALAGNWAAATSVRHLPIGIATALNVSFAIIVSSGCSYLLLDEQLSSGKLLWMLGIVGGVFALGSTMAPAARQKSHGLGRGIAASAAFGLCLGLGYTLIGMVSRRVEPLLVGYCWETSIALLGCGAVGLRSACGRSAGPATTRRDFLTIVLYSVPAAIGTACYASAVASGPVAVVTAVLSTMMVANALFARVLYRERLRRSQWTWIVLICGLVIGLHLATR